MNRANAGEPSYESAAAGWTDLPNIWTPVGWKDHLFRFNVLWNGAIFARPDLNCRSYPWREQGVNLTFVPMLDFKPEPGKQPVWPVFVTQDDGLVRQGWNEGDAPVLWSEWPLEGLLLRSEIFGHIPGGKAVRTGIEPLFAWVRLRVQAALPAVPLEKEVGFLVRINAPELFSSMHLRSHVIYYPPYPRELKPHLPAYSPPEGWRLEEGELVRLAIAPRQQCSVQFFPKSEGSRDTLLFIRMPARVGARVDLLVPMLPTERPVFLEELAVGRERALRQAQAFWRQRPATAATFHVPEAPLNEAIRHNLRFAEVVAEKNPGNGDYAMLTGSYIYANLWATPFAMVCIMILDALGYHATVEKYLEIFRKWQGTVKPPGDLFQLHPGYLSTPKTLTAIDWLSDHGALLYAISEHALLSGNRDFIARWTDVIVKACEFIEYARSLAGHGGVARLLPPAVATDDRTRIQAVWNDGWNYKGLATAARLLRQIGHGRAAEFAAAAADYRRTFQAAFRRKTAAMPVWTDARGRKHHLCPTALFGDQPREMRHGFYLDTGPLFLVFAGLLDAADPLMRSTLQWFRDGPPTAFYRRESNCWQAPCLERGMSSCEPCLSWNAFHSHQAGDRRAFLETMYSLFAGALSRKTYVPCETRGGITGLTPVQLPVWLARLAVIDDQIAEDELHLLRLLPPAWCRPGQTAVFDNMPTEFGPVTLRLSLARDRKTLDVTFRPAFRRPPAKIMLYRPALEELRNLHVNGKIVSARDEKVELTVCRMK